MGSPLLRRGEAGTGEGAVSLVSYVLIEFIAKWLSEGRFPREELRVRWWIAALGGIVFSAVAIALLIALCD